VLGPIRYNTLEPKGPGVLALILRPLFLLPCPSTEIRRRLPNLIRELRRALTFSEVSLPHAPRPNTAIVLEPHLKRRCRRLDGLLAALVGLYELADVVVRYHQRGSECGVVRHLIQWPPCVHA
jgi:hypothetical protein